MDNKTQKNCLIFMDEVDVAIPVGFKATGNRSREIWLRHS
jgi:hypothetical protein